MNNLLNKELVNDNLENKFDEAWKSIPVALEKEPADDLLQGLFIDSWRSRLPCITLVLFPSA